MNGTSPLQSFALAVALAVLLFTPGCSPARAVQAGMEMNGKEIRLKPGEALAVRLESNPTTGYGWQLAECDRVFLRPAGEPTDENAAGGKGRLGSGGWETFQFKALQAGQTKLKLVYLRPWEKDAAPAQTFEAQVSIQ